MRFGLQTILCTQAGELHIWNEYKNKVSMTRGVYDEKQVV